MKNVMQLKSAYCSLRYPRKGCPEKKILSGFTYNFIINTILTQSLRLQHADHTWCLPVLGG